ncbi:hypothetical protein FH972_021045 [Carpinus fangiana]|uniref:ARM repeat-containing protein n=1 Tax=Carpinus fangiana TaxID=176857 RepID=A0A5N6KNK2_9ROSI|nr:hypothetical protein FH972_021045 [Carpinus fangiana]
MIYIQQGLDRLTHGERHDLFKTAVSGISLNAHAPTAHSSGFFNLILRLLVDFDLPPRGSKEDDILRETLGLDDGDAQYLSHWFGKLLLLRPRSSISPGLSADDHMFLTLQNKADVWEPSSATGLNVTNVKMLVLKVIGSAMFKDEERLFPVLYASADQNSRLADPADEILKRAVVNVSLNQRGVVEQLYNVYFGNLSSDQPDSSSAIPASIFLRIKILGVLSRTLESLGSPEKIINIVERDLLENTAHAYDDSKVDRASEKLRSAIISFLTFAVRNANKDHLHVISEAVIPKLQQFIDGYVQDTMTMESKGVRGRSFEVVGLLASTNQNLLADPELSFLQWLFECLGREADRDVLVSIDEAVSAMLRPMQHRVATENQLPLQNLLLKNMSLPCRNVRNVVYASLRFTNRCLPFNNVSGRLIDLIAIGNTNNSHEIIEEAKKGLDPYWHETTSQDSDSADAEKQDFPNLVDLVKALDVSSTNPRIATNSNYRAACLSFCRETLLWRSLQYRKIKTDFSIDWKRKLDLAVAEDIEARTAIRDFLSEAIKDADGKEILANLWVAALDAMQSESAVERAATARFAYELCALGPHQLLSSFGLTLSRLAKIVLTNDIEVRLLASQSFGLIASHASLSKSTSWDDLGGILDRFGEIVSDWKNAVGSAVNQCHGATLSLCYWWSSGHGRQPKLGAPKNDERAQKVILPLVLEMLEKASDLTLQDCAIIGFGQICLARAVSLADVSGRIGISELVELLVKKAKAGNERAIASLGNLSLILDEDTDSEKLQLLIDSMHHLHEIRQAETQFAVGEALSTALCGWDCKMLQSRYDLEGSPPTGPIRTKTCASLLQRILTDCGTTKPALKKAAVIWLLCFIQYCGERSEIQNHLQQFQTAFKRCLSDRDELVQESASRGLGLVYERGGRDLKDDLVRDLIGSFSSNKAEMSGTVTEDTQLFEPGALPTGDGSITTYKDIMSLAAEVGDSSLVYRFMSLASNNAIWSSRAAFGRFGLSNVLSDSSVDGYLAANPKLYPKLYRYRFDPNSNVRKSMNDIWTALVKDSNGTIEANFDGIVEDLLVNIVSGRDWRARQASCAAIADLVQGRKLERVEPYLDRIWTTCFKVIDDIKESVRKAAAELARVLSALLIRTLEASEGSSTTAEQVLSKVLPFLLSTSGLESSADDVRALSLHTLLEIIKKGKARTLRPFLPELIEKLLGLLSTFEPESINYISLNASKYNLKEQDIDDVRLKGVRSSPLMEAIERCLDQLDDTTMPKVVTVLKEVIKSAVGMPTKVGVSRVLVSLCTRRTFLVRPHADELLQAVQKRTVDRNDTVSSSYAASLGYLARGASDKQILATVAFAKQLFFESEEERRQVVSGEVIHAIAKHASDRFAALAAAILPFVFLARHHDDERVKETFAETWEENVGGARAASLYLGEIVTLASEQLGSRRWGLKHAAARAIADAAGSIAAAQGSVSEAEMALIWPALRTALAEKSWEGKEKVLTGFVVVATKAPGFWASHDAEAAEVTQIALREARRRNAAYQEHAIGALGKIVAQWATPDPAPAKADYGDSLFDAVLEICRTAIESRSEGEDEDAMDVDVKSREAAKEAQSHSRTIAAAIEALTAVLPAGPPTLTYGALQARLSRILDVLLRAVRQAAAPVHLAAYDCCARSLAALRRQQQPDPAHPGLASVDTSDPNGARIEQLLFGQRDTILTEPVRQRRADAVLALSQLVTQAAQRDQLARLVQSAQGQEKSNAVRATLTQAQQHLHAAARHP